MARVDRTGGRAQINVAQSKDHVAGLEDDVVNLLAAGEAIDALNEVDIVRQPRCSRANRFAVAADRVKRCQIFEGHRKVYDARLDPHRLDWRQARLPAASRASEQVASGG